MLDQDPQIVDLDQAQFGRLFALFLRRTRAPWLYLVRDQDRVLSAFDTVRGHIPLEQVESVRTPETAESLASKLNVVGVVSMDRSSVAAFFNELESAYDPNEELDVFAVRALELWRSSYADRILVWPRPFQWLSKERHEAFRRRVRDLFGDREASAVLVVVDGAEVYLSVVAGFKRGRLTYLSTTDGFTDVPFNPKAWRDEYGQLLAAIQDRVAPVELAVFMCASTFQDVWVSSDRLRSLRRLVAEGQVLVAGPGANKLLGGMPSTPELHSVGEEAG